MHFSFIATRAKCVTNAFSIKIPFQRNINPIPVRQNIVFIKSQLMDV